MEEVGRGPGQGEAITRMRVPRVTSPMGKRSLGRLCFEMGRPG